MEEVKIASPLEYKSKMIIGNITIMNTKHFNFLEKITWRILLGIKIENILEES